MDLDDAQKRASRSQMYLVNNKRVDAGRIVTLVGGDREEAAVELFIVVKNGTPPEPIPKRVPYERVLDYHLQNAVYYFNRKEGVRISARLEKQDEDVQSITYEPGEKDLTRRCTNSHSQPTDHREPY